MRKEIYLNEYNVLMDGAVYLPLVSGQLQAYAMKNFKISENYEFKPFIFHRDAPEKIIDQYQNPSVAGFSMSMWNANLSLEIARKVKERFPSSLIVFGGYHAPNQSNIFLKENPFIDVVVRGEGEICFTDILERNLESRNFEGIAGVTYRAEDNQIIRNVSEQPIQQDLDIFPSPYLEGIFDNLIRKNQLTFQAIVETNRGCPHSCSYCSWATGVPSKKYRKFSHERIRSVAEWVGKNNIPYVFCSDSNFGIFKGDIDIAKSFIDSKRKYGAPEKFRVCYSKNAEENVFQIGKSLHKAGMEKSITLSFQTLDPQAAQNIRRKNIRLSTFNNLQKRYAEEGIPTYTELILGLPGETYNSFISGLEKCLESDIQNQLFVYHCQIYPNAEMGNKDYQKTHGIETVQVPLTEVHAVPRERDIPIEYEEIVISTNSMPLNDWKKASVISWEMQLLHGLKLGFIPLTHFARNKKMRQTDFFDYISNLDNLKDTPIFEQEITKFWNITDSLLDGIPKGQILPEFGPIYWEPEESAFLNLSLNLNAFYKEFSNLFSDFLLKKKIPFTRSELEDKIFEQNLRMSSLDRDYAGDKQEFAKRVILRGRKSGTILKARA